MVNPIKARQIGFFASVIAGIFHFLIIIFFLNYIIKEIDNGWLIDVLRTLDLVFPVFLLLAWKYGRRLGTKILIDDLPIYKTSFWSMVRLMTRSLMIAIVIATIYVKITRLIGVSSFEPDFLDFNIFDFVFVMIVSSIMFFIVNMIPSIISAAILSFILKFYKK